MSALLRSGPVRTITPFLVLLIFLLAALQWAHEGVYEATIVVSAVGFALLAAGLNIIGGFGGRLAFGNTIFFGVGAFAPALGVTHHWYSALTGMVIGVVISAIAAFILSKVLWRLAGLLFALVTFAMSIMLQELVSLGNTFGGPQGLQEPLATKTSITGLALLSNYDYAVVGVVLVFLAAVLTWWVRRSRFGQQLLASRDDRIAAEANGVNASQVTAYAWALSAAVTAIAGTYFVQANAFIDSTTAFGLNTGVNMIASNIIGGLGTVFGPFIGAGLVGAGLLLNRLSSGASLPGLNELVYGAALILVVRLAPGGIVGVWHSAVQAIAARRRPAHDPATAEEAGTGTATPAAGADGVTAAGLTGAASLAAEQAALAGHLRSDGLSPEQSTAGESGYLLEVIGVEKQFGGVRALNGVTVGVRPSEVVGLVGPNGAGKSTLFNCIEGIERLTAGEVKYQGGRIDRLPTHQRARLGMGRTFQHVRLFRTMSVLANVSMPLVARGVGRTESLAVATDLIRFARLEEVSAEPVSGLSVVHQRRVELARAVAGGSTMVLLDEVMTGLADEEATEIGGLIRTLSTEFGVAFLVVEHVMGRLVPVVDRLVVMDFGRVIAEGSTEEVLADARVREAYLGAGALGEAPQAPEDTAAEATGKRGPE
jgi:ABC-type branched-subunit amino acid transport system ATPase component/ABC-type branched-subunit amino acid transport system permease subunit